MAEKSTGEGEVNHVNLGGEGRWETRKKTKVVPTLTLIMGLFVVGEGKREGGGDGPHHLAA